MRLKIEIPHNQSHHLISQEKKKKVITKLILHILRQILFTLQFNDIWHIVEYFLFYLIYYISITQLSHQQTFKLSTSLSNCSRFPKFDKSLSSSFSSRRTKLLHQHCTWSFQNLSFEHTVFLLEYQVAFFSVQYPA